MKISIIGAGNVGGTAAMRLAHDVAAEIVLVDVAKGLAQGKAYDLEDCRPILKQNYHITGTDDINAIANSDIVVVTAGLPRKPGMTREGLLAKNSQILQEVSLKVKEIASSAILIIVTNPLDVMTYFACKITGFDTNRVFGMGISLDSARFANLISKELKVPPSEVDAMVIGAHGEAMMPLPRFTHIKGVSLEEFVDETKIEHLVKRTIERGKEIVELLGSGSAYYAPSAAIANMVRAVAKDEKRTIGTCAYLNGKYGLKDVCIGVPCRLGRNGIEEIVELDLIRKEREALHKAAEAIKEQYQYLPL